MHAHSSVKSVIFNLKLAVSELFVGISISELHVENCVKFYKQKGLGAMSTTQFAHYRSTNQSAFSGKHNVTVWRQSVCPTVFPVNIVHTDRDSQEAAWDAASVQFGPIMRRTDIGLLVYSGLSGTATCKDH